MTRLNFLLGIALCFSALASGQSGDPKPTFEIADVHVSPPTGDPYKRGPFVRRGVYEIRCANMVDLVSTAYGVDSERILGGPNWLDDDTFDVFAKVPEGTTLETAKPMLQSLLADRFQLTVHNDTKPVPAYAIKLGKHSLLKPSGGSGDAGCKPTGAVPVNGTRVFSYACAHVTMAAFAEALTETIFLAPQYLNGRLVVDETELKGAWDFDLKFTPRGGPPTGHVSLSGAIENQLGLRLDPVDVPMPVIIVDSVNQKPTPNLPNIAESLPVSQRPTEFEVAELKPSGPDSRELMFQVQPGGRVNVAGASLKFLIEQAWELRDDTLAGAPKWMDSDRYDIVAKSPVPDIDDDELWATLRALLVDRFHLVTHTEQRPVTAYTLVAVKPKLKKADPASRVKYKEGPAADGKDPRDKNPILSRLVTCQNMTMAQFAARLEDIAPGYIHTPVLDATGLEGGYDFTLSFSAVGLIRANPAGTPAPEGALDPAAASDPNGAVTLFEAVEKQLGLKLESQKRPVPVLVIDRAEQKPAEN